MLIKFSSIIKFLNSGIITKAKVPGRGQSDPCPKVISQLKNSHFLPPLLFLGAFSSSFLAFLGFLGI